MFQLQNFRLVEQFYSIFGNQFFGSFFIFFYFFNFLYIKYELRKLSFKAFSNVVVKHKYYIAKSV